eukprot:CAMPEP_0182605918 /NCGR_PEP_ID=MMETSP1330-20130603/846_1 /TAXON_ID=464278 /ORGANISM="Picochlorum sp., Strain RCC944" /LENGTH=65 /DNA_ID=CAMNT_0024824065 /DNA_START=14 /DNA_END=208 /DNA_ORIENTATION=+
MKKKWAKAKVRLAFCAASWILEFRIHETIYEPTHTRSLDHSITRSIHHDAEREDVRRRDQGRDEV